MGIPGIVEIEGFKLTDDLALIARLRSAMEKHTDGHCPCIPAYARSADTICACRKYRNGEGCHCGLYVRVQ